MANPFDKFDTINPFDRFDAPQQAANDRGMIGTALDKTRAFSVGLGRGVKDVIDTGADFASRLGGADENARIKAMNKAGVADFESNYGDSTTASVGRFGGNVAATMPVGGILAKGAMMGAKAAPTIAPMIANSLRTGGMSTGAPAATAFSLAGAKNAAIRVGGGAVSGGAMAGLINPEDAGTGALIGGTLPGAVKMAGESGKLLKEYAINPLFRPSKTAINKLVQDAGGIEPARLAIDRAIKAGKTMSGESYTLGQAGKNAGLASTERARSAVKPENFQPIYQAQRDARLNAMQKIGMDDVALDNAIAARSSNARSAYGAVEDKIFVGSDDLTGLLGRARAGGALAEAQKIAATEGRKFSIPVIEDAIPAGFNNADEAFKAAYGGMKDPGTLTLGGSPSFSDGGSKLLSEIRKSGGVSMKDAKDLMGENQISKMGLQGGVFSTKGKEVGDMVRNLVDKSVIPRQVLNDVDGGAQYLRDAIQKAAGGGDDMAMRGASEAYYGVPEALPLARETLMKSAAPEQALRDVIGQAVKGGDLHSVKMGIDQSIGTATGHQKAALVSLKKDFLEWMGNRSPEYLAANAKYAADSRPINQMKVGQKLTDVLTGEAYKYGANAGQNSASFFRALKNAPSLAKSETGMKQPLSKIFDSGQLSTIKRVSIELAKDVDLQNLGKGVGSDTAQKMARSNMLSSIAELANTSRIGRAAADVVSLGTKGRMNNQLDAMLKSPEYAGKALDDLTKPQRARLAELLANPAVRALPIAYQSR